MTEIPKGTQFVGQADARNPRVVEATKPVDVKLSPEQTAVADVMKQSGEVLENNVLDARDKAATQLKELHGKELRDAGLKQMGRGVWETFKSELKWGIPMYVLGAVGGAVGGYARTRDLSTEAGREAYTTRLSQFTGKPVTPMSARDAREMQQFTTGLLSGFGRDLGRHAGVFIGYETAGMKYNKKIAVKENLPSTKFVDWVVGNAANVGIQTLLKGRIGFVGQLVVNEVTNPITIGGLRNVATGLWQMRKG